MMNRNEEKAHEIANDKKIISLNKFGRPDIEATKWMSALEAMKWKDEKFKELVRDYIKLGYDNGEHVNLLEDLLNEI